MIDLIELRDRRVVFGWLVLLVILAAASYRLVLRRPGPTVWRYKVAVGDLRNTVESSGVVKPKNRVEILPPLDGRVEQVLVDQGQGVEKGKIMAWMSSTERAALLDATVAQGGKDQEQWQKSYRPTPILAPVGGLVIERNVVEGQTVTRGKLLFVLADRLIVKARVDESEIAKIRVGQSARIVTDAFPQAPFQARVHLVDYQSRDAGGVSAYEVELEPASLPEGLRSGMTARVEFLAGEKKGVLLLPVAAVGDARDSDVELTAMTPQGQIRGTVRLGLSDGVHVEVVGGLREGDEVLVKAPDFSAGGIRGLLDPRRRDR